MTKTYLYLPKELNDKVSDVAGIYQTSKAEVMRQAIAVGLKTLTKQKRKTKNSADLLTKLAKLGEKYKFHGPKDLSTNLDKYLWDDYEL